jgi:hypothetical protein
VPIIDTGFHTESSGRGYFTFGESKDFVFLFSIGMILESDNSEFSELHAQPTVTGIQKSELLAVRDDLGEEHLLEELLARIMHDHMDCFLDWNTHAIPNLLLQETIPHPHSRLERELLALAQFGLCEILVVLLEGKNTERNVTGFIAHDISEEFLEQRFGGHVVHETEGGKRKALNHDLHTQISHIPTTVGDDVVEKKLQVGIDRIVS